MEISFLSENIIPVPYKRGGEELELLVNIDAFTPEFWRLMKARAEEKFKALEAQIKAAVKEAAKPEVKGAKKPKKPTKKLTKVEQAKQVEEELRAHVKDQLDSIEGRARQLEAERETNIEFLLPHVLKGWNATDKGEPVALTKEVLLKLPPRFIQELFDICVKASKTVKKSEDDEISETSESTFGGSRGIHAVAQAS